MADFELEEYDLRIRKTKERMLREGIDVLVIADPANMNYLTGYDGWSFYVPQVVVLSLDKTQPIWIGRAQDAGGAKLTCWMEADSIVPYPEDHIHSSVRHPMDYVADVIRRQSWENRIVGVEMDSYYFTAWSFARLQHGLPMAQFKDATLLVNAVRMVKSNREIEYMTNAARIVELAMETAINRIRSGVRENEVAAEVMRAQIWGTPEFGGDYPSIVPLMPSGERTSTPHLSWTDRLYATGDAVNVEIAGCYKRYHAPMSRSVVIGRASQKLLDLSEVVIEGFKEALDAARPGATCHDVDAAWRAVVEKRNYVKDSRIGYSVGVNYPPDWGEHTASIRRDDRTILQPNMTFHLIPGMWLDGYGFELSETFRVTETGSESLVKFDRRLFVVDADVAPLTGLSMI